MSKEEIHDNQISPLMAQIIKLCKEHDIPFIASFQLTGEEDEEGPLFCSSCSLPKGSSAKLAWAMNVLYHNERGNK